MSDTEARLTRLEKVVTDQPDAPALIEEITAELVDPDTIPDDRGITPAMYAEHERVAQALVDSGDPDHPDIETARTNLDNLLRTLP